MSAKNCSKCLAPIEINTVRWIEMPPDVNSDEITLYVNICPRCGNKNLSLYEESRRGALGEDHWRYNQIDITIAGWDALNGLISACPNHDKPSCECPSHQILRVLDKKTGRWKGLDPFLELLPTDSISVPPEPKQKTEEEGEKKPKKQSVKKKKAKKKKAKKKQGKKTSPPPDGEFPWWHELAVCQHKLMKRCCDWLAPTGGSWSKEIPNGASLCARLEYQNGLVATAAQTVEKMATQLAGSLAQDMSDTKWREKVEVVRSTIAAAQAFYNIPLVEDDWEYGGLPFSTIDVLNVDGVKEAATEAARLTHNLRNAWISIHEDTVANGWYTTALALDYLKELNGSMAHGFFLASTAQWENLTLMTM